MNKSALLFATVVFLFCSCKVRQTAQTTMNQEVSIEFEKMLLGQVDRNGFQLPEYKPWFESTYQAYKPKKQILDQLGTKLDDVQIKVFLGTWCSDSQREIPALYQILDQLNYKTESLHMIAVDRSKFLPRVELKGYKIEYVPTIIFYRDQQELGRIIEAPDQSLEEDMLSIISR